MTAENSAAERIRRAFVEEIDSGALAPGEKLGNERQLAEKFDVSRGTIRQVFAALEGAGMVVRTPGRGGGTFVSRNKVERDLAGIQSVPNFLASQGYVAGTRIIGTQMAPPTARMRAAMQLADGDLVFGIRRIRLADGTPISLDYAHLPAARFPDLLEQSLGGSLYDVLRDIYGVEPVEADEELEVVYATDEEAELLSVEPHDPLIMVSRVTRDREGRVFEYSKDLFRSDRTRLRLRTSGPGGMREIVHAGATVKM